MDSNAFATETNTYYEEKFAHYIEGLDKDKIKELLKSWYSSLKCIYPGRFYGFGRNCVKELVGGICLVEVMDNVPEIEDAVLYGALNLVEGKITPHEFSYYMDEVIEGSPISTKLWNETYRHFEENYRWLERHEFSIGEIVY